MADQRHKYPRTHHLPWSPGGTDDDKILTTTAHFDGKQVIVTEKMDGENCTIGNTYTHARSTESRHHESRSVVKQLQGEIGHLLPENWRLCGENLYAKHSIGYDKLPAHFLLFSVWDDRNTCLSWSETVEWAQLLGLKLVPVLYKGPWDEDKITKLWDGKSRHGGTGEGYVVRLASSFPYSAFKNSVAKFVRPSHVQTDAHWMQQKVIPNKLAPKKGAWDKSPEGIQLRTEAAEELRVATDKSIRRVGWKLNGRWKTVKQGMGFEHRAEYNRTVDGEDLQLNVMVRSTGKTKFPSVSVTGGVRFKGTKYLRRIKHPLIRAENIALDDIPRAIQKIDRDVKRMDKTIPIFLVDYLQGTAAEAEENTQRVLKQKQINEEKAQAELDRIKAEQERAHAQLPQDLYDDLKATWHDLYGYRAGPVTDKWRGKSTMEFESRPLPRFDHGGGEDGDDWMDEGQQSDLTDAEFDYSAPPIKKVLNDPKYKGLVKDWEMQSVSEKGYWELIVELTRPKAAMTDLSKRIAHAWLTKTAKLSVHARLGTVRFGPNSTQEMWLYTTLPGRSNLISWDTLEDARVSLSSALEMLKRALKKHGGKVGYVGKPFLIGGNRLEVAMRVDQTGNDPIHVGVNNALWDAGIEKGK